MNTELTVEQYIEHEVKLRVHDERFKITQEINDDKFKSIHQMMAQLKQIMIGVTVFFIGSIIIPVILHHYGMI